MLSLRAALAAALSVAFSSAALAQAPAPATKPAAPAPAAAAAAASTVVVSGPAGNVTQGELESMVNEVVPPAQRAGFWAKPEMVDRMARTIYNQRALARDALAGGVDKTRAGAEYLQLVRERALSKLWLDQHAQAAAPNPKAVTDFARSEYRAQPDRFKTPEQVQVRHILLPLAPDGSDDAAVKARAEELLAQARKGADFAKLAAQYSSDKASAQRGGDLGFFGRGKMLPEFENAAFGLKKPGDLAGPVKTRFGYHIIELVAHKPASAAKFEDVAPELEQEAKAKIEGQARERLWDAAGAGAKVNEAAIKAMAEQASR